MRLEGAAFNRLDCNFKRAWKKTKQAALVAHREE